MNAFIQVGSRKLYTEIYGQGKPTVVIEVGSTQAGTLDKGWQPVRDALASQTSVLLYDRAGLGRSDPVCLPRSISDFTADLHAVLHSAWIKPPYILVGGSFGGLITTHYAGLYPQEVAGIVLEDSTHPEHDLRTLELLPIEAGGESPALTHFRKLLWQETYEPLSTNEEEGLDFPTSIQEMHAAWDLGDIPLIVLTAGRDEWEPGFPDDVAARYEQLWLDLQKELAARSTSSTHIIVEESGHCIHVDVPQAVVSAVRRLLQQARNTGIDEFN